MFARRLLRPVVSPALGAGRLNLNRGLGMTMGTTPVPSKVPIFGASGKISIEPPTLTSEPGQIVERIVAAEMNPIEVTVTNDEIKKALDESRESIKLKYQTQIEKMQGEGWFTYDFSKPATEEDKKRIQKLTAEVMKSCEQDTVKDIVKKLMKSKVKEAQQSQSSAGKSAVPAKLAQLTKDINFFAAYLQTQGELRNRINTESPLGVKNLLVYVFSKMEKKLAPHSQKVVADVFCSIKDRNRVQTFYGVREKLAAQVGYAGRMITAEVSSAEALSPAQKTRISKALQSRVDTGVTIETVFSIDPALMGGFRIQYNDRDIDFSAKCAIENRLEGYLSKKRELSFDE
eukprot:gb/GEZN01011458.1/.p1 GENE.gb/GEZN01011458.1/~~gb/GEZN01011458.1/.p1  ORF type:complete len:345 (+),score=68.16 gb/GEZN01011458.1/:102-1136(+)